MIPTPSEDFTKDAKIGCSIVFLADFAKDERRCSFLLRAKISRKMQKNNEHKKDRLGAVFFIRKEIT